MNRVVIIGNLTGDPESSTTQNGNEVCRLRIAVDRSYRNKDGERQTDFFTVACWGTLATNCSRFLTKGRRVAVTGRMENHSYEGRDGQTRYVTEITADEVEFLGSPDR